LSRPPTIDLTARDLTLEIEDRGKFMKEIIIGIAIALPFPELSKIKSRHSSGCGPMVVAEHSAEALSALNGMMG
jgi:hypothetical protein